MELKDMVMMTLSELEEEPSTQTKDEHEIIETQDRKTHV